MGGESWEGVKGGVYVKVFFFFCHPLSPLTAVLYCQTVTDGAKHRTSAVTPKTM